MYEYVATAQLVIIGGLLYALADLRDKRNQERKEVARLNLVHQADQAAMRSVEAKIEAINEDFQSAVEIAVNEIRQTRSIANELAREVREAPEFAAHLNSKSEGCTLCSLVAKASKV